MLFFWVLAGLLTCSAIALVVWPLLRRTDDASADEERRLAVYRDRRREIRRELDAGRLSAAEAERAEAELVAEAARQFAPADGDADRARNPARPTASRVTAIVAALAIPLAALAVYDRLGAPGLVAIDAATMRGELTPERVAQIVGGLEQRVARSPDDGEGWAMLAEALRLKNEPARAAEAYDKATGLLPGNARLLADYAETLVIVNQGEFAGRPVELLERALRIDPKDGKATALMGAAQYRLGNLESALKYLKQLTEGMPEDSPEVRQLAGAVARIEAELAARGSAGRGAPAAAATIAGSITVDPALRASAPKGATIFVVARAADGPRVPIAVLRLQAGDAWPLRFELSDAQAMDPSRKLSSADRIVVEARVSATGDAARRSGDPFGTSAPLKPGARDVALRIDQRVP